MYQKKSGWTPAIEMFQFVAMVIGCVFFFLVLVGAGAKLSIAAFDLLIDSVCYLARTAGHLIGLV